MGKLDFDRAIAMLLPHWRKIADVRRALRAMAVGEDTDRLRSGHQFVLLGLVSWVCLTVLTSLVSIIFLTWDRHDAGTLNTKAALPKEVPYASTDFDAILQRPLFSRSRQRSLTSEESPASRLAVDVLPQVVLKGVYIGGARSKAFLTGQQNPAGSWLGTGDEIDGWQIAAIEPSQVILRANTQQTAIEMSFTAYGTNRAAQPPTAPAALPPRFGIPPNMTLSKLGLAVSPGGQKR